jgi:hypothetical protein
MARTTVYRSIGSVRRTSIPRSPRMTVGTSVFGRMLAKLSLASDSLEQSRPKRRR